MGSRVRNSPRAAKAHSIKPAPKPRHKPTLNPAPKLAEAAVKDIRRRLELIHDVIITVAIALRVENAEHDLDFENVLTRLAADPLWDVLEMLGGADVDIDTEVGHD